MTLHILVAFERSGVVREAFNAYAGVRAVSCDLEPPEDGRTEQHMQGDAFEALASRKWRAVIAHPPCTLLANSGALRLYKGGKFANGVDAERWERMQDAARLFRRLFTDYDGPLCVENPIMHSHARELIALPDVLRQTIQPHDFGHDAKKATQLWLRDLPRLQPTQRIPGRMVARESGRMVEVWSNQTDSGQNKLGPSPTRAMDRARTYSGIASAMAATWVPWLLAKG